MEMKHPQFMPKGRKTLLEVLTHYLPEWLVKRMREEIQEQGRSFVLKKIIQAGNRYELMEAVTHSFTWSAAREGVSYWSELYNAAGESLARLQADTYVWDNETPVWIQPKPRLPWYRKVADVGKLNIEALNLPKDNIDV